MACPFATFAPALTTGAAGFPAQFGNQPFDRQKDRAKAEAEQTPVGGSLPCQISLHPLEGHQPFAHSRMVHGVFNLLTRPGLDHLHDDIPLPELGQSLIDAFRQVRPVFGHLR